VLPPSEALRPFLTLKSLGLSDLAEQYLLGVLEGSSNSADLRLALSRLHAEEKKPALALLDARRTVPRASEYEFSELPEEIWQRLYPQEFLPLVKRHARANRLDPALVLGLIRQESAFDPRATSVANARGLMQILPQTVSSRKRGRAQAARRLYDPAYNVRFGTRHLAGLLKSFGNSPEPALAAYHAGESRVRDWVSKHSFQEPAEFLETIPIPATRAYVEALLRDVGIYQDLLKRSAKFARCR
jgi:soluble lytic murein transglycosylase